MKKRILVLLLISGVMLGCLGEEDSDIPTTTKDTPETITPAPEETGQPETPNSSEKEIEWLESVEKAKEIAQEENKLIYVDFNADFCVWCQKLEEETYKNNEVITLINKNFVPVFFDLDKEENKKIYKEEYRQYVQDSLPTMLILDSNGKPLYRITGYKESEKLTELLHKALEETS